MAMLNLESMLGDRQFVRNQYSWQAVAGPASSCIQCGSCEEMCPQSIHIRDELEKACAHFED